MVFFRCYDLYIFGTFSWILLWGVERKLKGWMRGVGVVVGWKQAEDSVVTVTIYIYKTFYSSRWRNRHFFWLLSISKEWKISLHLIDLSELGIKDVIRFCYSAPYSDVLITTTKEICLESKMYDRSFQFPCQPLFYFWVTQFQHSWHINGNFCVKVYNKYVCN